MADDERSFAEALKLIDGALEESWPLPAEARVILGRLRDDLWELNPAAMAPRQVSDLAVELSRLPDAFATRNPLSIIGQVHTCRIIIRDYTDGAQSWENAKRFELPAFGTEAENFKLSGDDIVDPPDPEPEPDR